MHMTAIQPLACDVSDAVRSSQAVSSPAQAALELVYNALDAGATEVVVALDVGALSITVRDNGRGIAAAELALVGERHATSKLRALQKAFCVARFASTLSASKHSGAPLIAGLPKRVAAGVSGRTHIVIVSVWSAGHS